ARISVVLPLPLGPSSPVTDPAGTSKSSPRSTGRPPRSTTRPRTSTALSAIRPPKSTALNLRYDDPGAGTSAVRAAGLRRLRSEMNAGSSGPHRSVVVPACAALHRGWVTEETHDGVRPGAKPGGHPAAVRAGGGERSEVRDDRSERPVEQPVRPARQ